VAEPAKWQPTELIPHREPFLLLTEIIELVPGESAKGFWRLSGEEDFFKGHFPSRPTVPGVLMVESLAQLGAAAVLADSRYSGLLPLFGGIDKVRFRNQVLPGDILNLEVTMGHISTRAGKGLGRAHVNGKLACEAELLFVFVPH
jgi:3-hydroxyacyl-[acyl-carrier-protein] dehydratase